MTPSSYATVKAVAVSACISSSALLFDHPGDAVCCQGIQAVDHEVGKLTYPCFGLAGSRSLSPAGQEHRSKKKRHHEKGDREGEKKHKHKHKKRHDRELRDAPLEEREVAGTKDQDQEEKELRQLALSALDTPAPQAANTVSDPTAPAAP